MSRRQVRVAAIAYGLLFPAGALLLAAAVHGRGSATGAVFCIFVAALAHLSIAFAPQEHRLARWQLMVPAVFGAIILFAIPPALSDDVYRYLLDGTAVSHGFSPFSHAPSSAKVADLVAALPGRINHPELPTIYPPFAQLLFGAVATMGVGLAGWKVMLIGALAAGAVLTGKLRPQIGSITTPVWIFSHPLALLTAAGNGNVDVVGVLLVAAACVAARHRREWVVGFLIGLAAGVKLFPLGLFTARLGQGGIRRASGTLAVGLLALALLYAPVASSGPKAFGSLGRYAEAWEFNASAHSALTSVLDVTMGAVGVPGSVRVGTTDEPTYYEGEPTFDEWRSRRELASAGSKLVGLGFTGMVVLLCWRRRLTFEESTSWILSTLFLTAAVVHPWYLLWLLAPAVAVGHRFGLAWCAAATAAFWAPAVLLDGGDWQDPVWVRCVEYGFAGGFAAIACARLTRRPPPA